LRAGHGLNSQLVGERVESFSASMFSWYASLTITTGAVPQEPRHSTVPSR
jgi:hypothetical protein